MDEHARKELKALMATLREKGDEVSMNDAPSWLNNEEANAWSSGFSRAIDTALELLEDFRTDQKAI